MVATPTPPVPPDAPAAFRRGLDSMRGTACRPEVHLTEVPAPARIAPWSVALTADVVVADADLGSGRFVVLHDPAGQDAWDGTTRLVTMVRAELEPELAGDPMLGEVGWSWLEESLETAGAGHRARGGTVTRVVSESFEVLADRPTSVEIEIRASWTPTDDDLGAHLAGWTGLLCTVAGLPPLPEGVLPMRRRSPLA